MGQHHQVVVRPDDPVGGGHDAGAVRCGEDADHIDIVLGADVGGQDALAHPLPQRGDLIDGVAPRQVDKVKDVVVVVLDGGAQGNILVGVDDLVRAVAEQELGVYLVVRLADDVLGPQVLQKAGDLQVALEIAADTDKAQVKIGYADAPQDAFPGAVGNHAAGGCVQ